MGLRRRNKHKANKWDKLIMNDKIKEYRAFSICAFILVAYWLNSMVEHLLTSPDMSNAYAGAFTGLSAALVAALKFIFEFAVDKKDK